MRKDLRKKDSNLSKTSANKIDRKYFQKKETSFNLKYKYAKNHQPINQR